MLYCYIVEKELDMEKNGRTVFLNEYLTPWQACG
jgi:hypothetical protein